MKKVLLSSVFIIALAGYVIYQHLNGQTNAAVSNNGNQTPIQTTQTVTPTIPAKTTSNTSSNPPQSKTQQQAGLYKDGTYTGNVEDAYYGNLQVQAVIKNGALANVNFLQYPNSHGHSVEISNSAMPILKSEAIKSQSANVNIISGATQTSQAFQQSLASALALAKN